jgi:uncharacterized protein
VFKGENWGTHVTKHINELIASRRAILGGFVGLPLLNLAGCATSPPTASGAPAAIPAGAAPSFASVAATNADAVTIPPGYAARTLIAWGDALFDSVSASFDPDALTRAEQEQRFGQNNDMLALFPADYAFPPAKDQDRMILCANQEYADLFLMFPGVRSRGDFERAHIESALAATGVSVVGLERVNGAWRPTKDAAPGAGLNRRITPFTPMVFSGPAANHPWILAAGAFVNAHESGRAYEPNPPGAIRCGTSANCAGGKTPWGTYLTSEENFNYLFVATDEAAPALVAAQRDGAFVLDCASMNAPAGGASNRAPPQYDMSQSPYGAALYGWVVEIDPYDPSWAPRKRTALGRKKGECATTALARDGRVAVYAGDDQANEFVYKFVSRGRFNPADRLANRDLLDDGQIYVARFEEDGTGAWLAVTLDAANAAAREAEYPLTFNTEADLAVRLREAARLMGATPMDRPEDVEALLDGHWVGQGPVLIACTNNGEQGFARPGNPRRESADGAERAQANRAGHIVRVDEAGDDAAATRFTWDVFALAGDPDAAAPVAPARDGRPTHISTKLNGAPTFTGARFACPDNLCIDSSRNVWIATDSSDNLFADCNDAVLVAPAAGEGAPVVKRFLVVPVGAEATGPCMALDERAFFLSVQHPGESDVAGVSFAETRWTGAPPPSNFPDGNGAWPRSAVVVITRDDGGRIGS